MPQYEVTLEKTVVAVTTVVADSFEEAAEIALREEKEGLIDWAGYSDAVVTNYPESQAPTKAARKEAGTFDADWLRVELVRHNMTQLDLAKRLGCPVSTLSGWVRGVSRYPHDLRERIENELTKGAPC